MDNLVVQLDRVDIYQGQHKVLQEVDLRIAAGEFSYLIGKTGSGKSSLLKAIYAALPIHSGTGTVCGYDLTQLTRRTIPGLRRQLGIVFQDFNLLADRSVEQNLRFVLRATGWTSEKNMRQRMFEVLTSVGLADKLKSMPHELSGGEQQRIVIARALLNEPTGNLDPETSDDIVLLLRKLNQEHNTAILFATHDYRILENFPGRIIRCQNQRLIMEEEVVIDMESDILLGE